MNEDIILLAEEIMEYSKDEFLEYIEITKEEFKTYIWDEKEMKWIDNKGYKCRVFEIKNKYLKILEKE